MYHVGASSLDFASKYGWDVSHAVSDRQLRLKRDEQTRTVRVTLLLDLGQAEHAGCLAVAVVKEDLV
jgi:hypothetical protein